ncbi:DUF7687 domain-containing protein [Candidatus Poriferisodalis sp.]|uniref:DUF7687 domain-containing protein n=1 Tax=Candidatus Poriferisodalis sp. TaxID=3101277 RepID=UPI003B029BBF
MQPDPRFLNQSDFFWAYVRAVGEQHGYSIHGKSEVKAPNERALDQTAQKLGIPNTRIRTTDGLTPLGEHLLDYFQYRAEALNSHVQHHLMDVEEVSTLYMSKLAELDPSSPQPMNKQRGEKKVPAYFTGLINMLIEAAIGDTECDYDPKQLTKVTDDAGLVGTLARRVDGAYRSVIDPIAIWEIKEYYYTTTFGSRVAGGIYETLLDGMELKKLATVSEKSVAHYFFLDSHRTWWGMGRSYLCRLVDAMHMGYVDEVIFGREIVDRIPALVRDWTEATRDRQV